MKKLIPVIFIIISTSVNAADGILNVESPFSVTKTADKFALILNDKGMTVFNRIKHSESAAEIGIQLRDTELIIFGNPKAGSPLMKCQQSMAIDLPQKALIWEDENKKVWISYNDIRYLEKRHNVHNCEKVISKVEKILANITKLATSK